MADVSVVATAQDGVGRLGWVGYVAAMDGAMHLHDLLDEGVRSGVFPGAVALVMRRGAIVYHEAHGTKATHAWLASSWHRPTERNTVYDLASLTKILCTTTLAALAVAEGRVDLGASVPKPWEAACPGATLSDLLEHASGLIAHREYFDEVQPFHPTPILERVMSTPIGQPRGRGAVYSDLGFMILGAWMEKIYDSHLADAFEDHVLFPLGLRVSSASAPLRFRPVAGPITPEELQAIAPTEVYDPALHPSGVPSHFRIRQSQRYALGVVHDDNAYVMGGVAGHAGLFGTAEGVLRIAQAWLELGLPGLDRRTRDVFWRRSRVPGSSRCLGFDGATPEGSCGPDLRPSAIGHTGYTGTSLWIDPDAAEGPLIAVLLSNRVHPTRDNTAIQAFRRRFHSAALKLCR